MKGDSVALYMDLKFPSLTPEYLRMTPDLEPLARRSRQSVGPQVRLLAEEKATPGLEIPVLRV